MSRIKIHLSPIFAVVAALPTLTSPPKAQIPEAHALLATYTIPGWPGTPGLFLIPLRGGPTTRITGLPPELVTDSLDAYQAGAWNVARRSSDGALLVGTVANMASFPHEVSLYVMHLNGTAVDPTRTRKIQIGTATTHGGCEVTPMPDGRVLIHADQGHSLPLSGGPMANHFFAIVDLAPATPTFTLLPNPVGAPGQTTSGGQAVDPTGRFAYYLVANNQYATPPWNSTLLRLDLATGVDCAIASWTDHVAVGVVCEDDGTLYVRTASAAGNQAVQHLHTIRPDGCNPAQVSTRSAAPGAFEGAWGMGLDRAARMLVDVAVKASPLMGDVSLVDPQTLARTVIATAPAGGWGLVCPGVVVNNIVESYGPRSDGQSRHWFANFTNPGGQPTVGNAAFSLTMASAPTAPMFSMLVLSGGRTSIPMLGIDVLVDPSVMISLLVPGGLSVPVPLPIPNDAGLRGAVLTAQAVHAEQGNVLAATRGLTLTVQ